MGKTYPLSPDFYTHLQLNTLSTFTYIMRDNKTYYDEFSHWYERQRHQGYHALIDNLQFDLIKDDVVNRDVLEIGCGTGLILQRANLTARHATGVDISPGMLKTARDRNLDVVEAGATDLPFPDNSFDLVYSFKVLAHIQDIDQALREAIRVTRPNGLLYLDFYNRYSLRYLVKRLAGPQMISETTDEGVLYTRWDTPDDILRRLPQTVDLLDLFGIRIVTPAASLHRLPLLAPLLSTAERTLKGLPPFRKFGGFLVVKLRKLPA